MELFQVVLPPELVGQVEIKRDSLLQDFSRGARHETLVSVQREGLPASRKTRGSVLFGVHLPVQEYGLEDLDSPPLN